MTSQISREEAISIASQQLESLQGMLEEIHQRLNCGNESMQAATCISIKVLYHFITDNSGFQVWLDAYMEKILKNITVN